jgi:hypothetical protein
MLIKLNSSPLLSWFLTAIALSVLGFIFASYFAPEMVVALTNQVWALCGW